MVCRRDCLRKTLALLGKKASMKAALDGVGEALLEGQWRWGESAHFMTAEVFALRGGGLGASGFCLEGSAAVSLMS